MSTWGGQNKARIDGSSSSRGRGTWRGRGRGHGGSSSTKPANRRMENIASVSRSSGLQGDGDALKNLKTQEEYREFIDEKLNDFWKRYPRAGGAATQQQIDAQENILILFRKLREGIVSSKRQDQFALEVYETSLYLATLFRSPKQVGSIISHLVPDLYARISEPHRRRRPTILVALLHQLAGFPSQGIYYSFLQTIPDPFLPRSSKAYIWLSSVASSLRMHNHCKFEQLTRTTSFSSFLDENNSSSLDGRLSTLSLSSQSEYNLMKKAFHCVIDELRAKARESAWTVIRAAYREISCHADSPTREWLAKTLVLQNTLSDSDPVALDQWLQGKCSLNHVRPKEGTEGRWIICKVPK